MINLKLNLMHLDEDKSEIFTCLGKYDQCSCWLRHKFSAGLQHITFLRL